MAVNGAEVLFEFHRVGNTVKVTAFHVPTLTEVSVVGAANAGEMQLKLLGLRRLEYVLAKKQAGG
ncbi:MAG: hypothetical protein HY055_03170 [Magnetospirillum sp.]|nr:hypothetical protein [Magnetospirillum sp.]